MGLPAERLSDEALLAGLASGDRDFPLVFVRRFQGHVFGVAMAVTGDPGLAEDIAQQTFERVWRRCSTFDARRGNVRGWLTAITRNLAVDALRVRKPEPFDPTDLIRLLSPADDEPDAVTIRNDSRARLRVALRRLPPEQGRALVMAGVYRMTAQEVADNEKIPLGTAKTRIRSAMIKLRQQLSAAEVTHE